MCISVIKYSGEGLGMVVKNPYAEAQDVVTFTSAHFPTYKTTELLTSPPHVFLLKQWVVSQE